MNLEESLQLGFLSYCADQGMTQEETHTLVKKASEKEAWSRLLTAPLGSATHLISSLGPLGITALLGLGIGVPAAAGAGAGHLLAKATEKDIDPEEAKGDEVIEQYQRLTDQARRRALLKSIQGVPVIGQKTAAIEKLAGILSGLGSMSRTMGRALANPRASVPLGLGIGATGGSYGLHRYFDHQSRQDPMFQAAQTAYPRLDVLPGGISERSSGSTAIAPLQPGYGVYQSPPNLSGRMNEWLSSIFPGGFDNQRIRPRINYVLRPDQLPQQGP